MTISTLARASTRPPASLVAEFLGVLANRTVGCAYQPIVDIVTGEVVAYEALARGPAGSRLESPVMLFELAQQVGKTAELDWVCRAAAFRGAINAGYGKSRPLFVNVEPATITSPVPADLREVVAAAREELSVMMEITERAITSDPRGLLAAVGQCRRHGWKIALDDVGVEASSLALMPFLRPDVIKLDLRFVQEPGHPGNPRVISAVAAEAERSGASVLTEGVETLEHINVARSLGGSLCQGYYFGRPAMLPLNGSNREPRSFSNAPTPFSVVAAKREVHRATKELLLPISRQLEQSAATMGDAPVLLGAFQDVRFLTPATRKRWRRLASETVFTAAMGVNISEEPEPGVRGATLAADDPLRGEWDVIAIGPHFAGALAARDLGDTGIDRQRRFDYVVTYDRELVIQAAQTLMERVAPSYG